MTPKSGGRARVQQAQAALDRLGNPASQNQIAGAEAQVRSAQAELDLPPVGARGDPRRGRSRRGSGRALKRAQADLANTELHAPFSGTITRGQGESRRDDAGGPVALTLAERNHLRAETMDLSERDIARVSGGQPITVFVDALGKEIPSRVARIAPQANLVGSDVVYTVIVDLDSLPPGDKRRSEIPLSSN